MFSDEIPLISGVENIYYGVFWTWFSYAFFADTLMLGARWRWLDGRTFQEDVPCFLGLGRQLARRGASDEVLEGGDWVKHER